MTNNKYSNLVNFKTNLNQGRHSWFEIKEGYSFDLLDNVLKDLKIDKKSGFILDPFSGSGTTILQSSIIGFNSVGIEVNPFLKFLSKVKCQKYSDDYEFYKKRFLKINFQNKKKYPLPKLSISTKLFKEQKRNGNWLAQELVLTTNGECPQCA